MTTMAPSISQYETVVSPAEDSELDRRAEWAPIDPFAFKVTSWEEWSASLLPPPPLPPSTALSNPPQINLFCISNYFIQLINQLTEVSPSLHNPDRSLFVPPNDVPPPPPPQLTSSIIRQ